LLISAVLISMLASSGTAYPVKVVTTTTTLADLVSQVGGDKVEVESIVSSGVCPDHWDLKPSQLAALLQADVVLQHGMEAWLANRTAEGQAVVKLTGPWNIPDLAINKTESVRDILKAADPDNSTFFDQNADDLVGQLSDLSAELQAQAAEKQTGQYRVICMAWQNDFVEWMGFDVVKTYGSEETLSLKDVDDIIKAGEETGATVVVDNLQSGVKTGGEIAAEIDAQHVVLTNFPGAVEGTDTLLDMIRYNGQQILAAV